MGNKVGGSREEREGGAENYPRKWATLTSQPPRILSFEGHQGKKCLYNLFPLFNVEEEKEQGKVTGGQTEACSGYRKGQSNVGGKERQGTAGLSHLRVRALPAALRRRSLLDWVWRLVGARNQLGARVPGQLS